MALKLKNKQALTKHIKDFGLRYEKALVLQLSYMVADLENHAKESAGYTDRTSNLKGSIGGVVLKDGKPIKFEGFDGGGSEGKAEGLTYINSLIDNFSSGYVMILVAGMEYAAYVEDVHGLNVLKKSELKMFRELPKALDKLKQKLN